MAPFSPHSPIPPSSCSPQRSSLAPGRRKLISNNVPDASSSPLLIPTVLFVAPNAEVPITISLPITRIVKDARTQVALSIRSSHLIGSVPMIVASIAAVHIVRITRPVRHVMLLSGKLASVSLVWPDKLSSTPVTFVVPALLTSGFNLSFYSVFLL